MKNISVLQLAYFNSASFITIFLLCNLFLCISNLEKPIAHIPFPYKILAIYFDELSGTEYTHINHIFNL